MKQNGKQQLTRTLAITMLMCLLPSFHTITPVFADSTTSDIGVTANVPSTCKITQTQNLAFGTYDTSGANNKNPLDSTAPFQVRCTRNTTATIKLNNGLYGSNAVGTTRALYNSGTNQFLNYELYTNAARTTIWNQSTGVVNYNATSAAPTTITIYGRIPEKQNQARGGTYTDTITISVQF